MSSDVTMTITEARKLVLDGRTKHEGIECPVCDQLVKVYARKINSAMAFVLVHMVRRYDAAGTAEWLHLPSFIKSLPLSKTSAGSGGDYSKLQLWGLVERRPGARADGSNRNGHFRVTDAGVAFVKQKTEVFEIAYVTNNTVLGWSDSKTNIVQTLGKKFNYDELMTT